MVISAATLHAQHRRRFRQNVSQYAALIATPGAGSVALPADGNLAVSASAGSAGGVAVVFSGRSISVPVLVANQIYLIGRWNRGLDAVVDAGFDLLVDTGLGNFKKICTGA